MEIFKNDQWVNPENNDSLINRLRIYYEPN
jgi:hypothetical protein